MVRARRRSRLRRGVQEELIKYFCAGVTARSAAQIAGVNRNTAILFYHKLREVIFAELEAEAPELMRGEIEVDESYFGGHRKGKRGRGAAGKVAVFGLLKRQGKVHVVIIPDARSDTLIPIIREKIRPDSIVYTDAFKSYDVLDVSEFKHLRINHSVLLPISITTSMESRISGTKLSAIYAAITASPSTTSPSSSKSANGASITAPYRICTKP